MNRRDDVIDYLLGELSPEESHRVAGEVAADPETAAMRDLYADAIGLVRQVAEEGWEAPPASRGRMRWLRPALAAAAVLLVAVGIFWMDGGARGPQRVDDLAHVAFGSVMPEETDAAGRVRVPGRTGAYRLRDGSVEVAAPGSPKVYTIARGETIPPNTNLTTPADSAARIDLPHGGILYLAPLSELRVRLHQNGEAALRLIDGTAYTVVGARPLHLAVEETDLLLDQQSGAALLRAHPAEAICLRGRLFLRLADGKRYRVPETERLPAACAKAPRTAPVKHEELELEEWYLPLVYATWRSECIDWERPGRSMPLETGPETLLYVRAVAADADGARTLTVTYGGAARTFDLPQDGPLELRLRVADLGPGPRLEIAPAAAVKQARLFEGTPR